MNEKSFPVAKFDKQGRVVCPTCGNKMTVPADRYLGRGPGKCAAGHDYFFTDEVSFAINDILGKQRGQDWRKAMLMSFEPLPDGLVLPDGKGKVVVPTHDLLKNTKPKEKP